MMGWWPGHYWLQHRRHPSPPTIPWDEAVVSRKAEFVKPDLSLIRDYRQGPPPTNHKTMNKIKSYIQEISKPPQESVMEISERILEKIDLTMDKIPPGFNYPIDAFRIIKTERAMGVLGRVRLLEINPIACRWPMGTKGAINATWITPDGDRTVNLPPPEVLADFWRELNNHLSE